MFWQLVLAVLVLLKGIQLLWEACQKEEEKPPPQDASQHWAVKGLQRVVPVKWSDETDGACWARDEEGRVFVTRSLALVVTIGCSDLTFSSDNITAVLALVRSAGFQLARPSDKD